MKYKKCPGKYNPNYWFPKAQPSFPKQNFFNILIILIIRETSITDDRLFEIFSENYFLLKYLISLEKKRIEVIAGYQQCGEKKWDLNNKYIQHEERSKTGCRGVWGYKVPSDSIRPEASRPAPPPDTQISVRGNY